MLDGKLALVTGAGQGMGRAIALEMASRNCRAVAVADRDRDSIAETARLIGEAGGEALPVVCDLRDRDQIVAMFDEVAVAFGGLDVLVNNAGVIETALTTHTAIDELPDEVWDAVYEINLKAVWLTIKFAAPLLKRSSRGPSIVNAASVSGLIGFARAPIYCASKAGVIQLTRAAAIDLAPRVRCNCYCPGVIETSMARAFIDKAEDRAAQERAMVATQLVDRLGRPEEVAKLACFLASDESAFITGATFTIDGGALTWHGVRDSPSVAPSAPAL
jgi:NAD(P)-dependent dehydrogenase (short-subunit alcohol dehydrogenase family)